MNFAGDLLRSAGHKLVGGAKSILGAPGSAGVELFGTNVPLFPLISYRNHFLRCLSSWSGSIPNQFMWLVLIDRFPPAIQTSMLQYYEPVGDGGKIGNNIDSNVRTVTSAIYQRIAGCVFAQGVSIPNEAVTYDYANTSNPRGFLGGLYSNARGNLQPLVIQMTETNTSFTDFVIRPWTILTSHLGLVARPGDVPENGEVDPRNIKTNITVIQLAKTYQKRSSVQRKVWRFYNCAPFQTDVNNLVRETEGNVINMSTQWHYTHYTVGGLPFVPVEEIIDNFGTGQLTNIINGITQVTGNSPLNKVSEAAKKVAPRVFG
jgi:hypothetical protein